MQLHCVGKPVPKQRPVGQTGERIAQRLIGDLDPQPAVLTDDEELPDHHGEHGHRRRNDDRSEPRNQHRGADRG